MVQYTEAAELEGTNPPPSFTRYLLWPQSGYRPEAHNLSVMTSSPTGGTRLIFLFFFFLGGGLNETSGQKLIFECQRQSRRRRIERWAGLGGRSQPNGLQRTRRKRLVIEMRRMFWRRSRVSRVIFMKRRREWRLHVTQQSAALYFAGC